MRILIISALVFNLGFSAVVDDYLSSLKQEVLQENPKFIGFDAKRGEEIFTSKHIGKKGKEIACTSCHGIDLNKSSENFLQEKLLNHFLQKQILKDLQIERK